MKFALVTFRQEDDGQVSWVSWYAFPEQGGTLETSEQWAPSFAEAVAAFQRDRERRER